VKSVSRCKQGLQGLFQARDDPKRSAEVWLQPQHLRPTSRVTRESSDFSALLIDELTDLFDSFEASAKGSAARSGRERCCRAEWAPRRRREGISRCAGEDFSSGVSDIWLGDEGPFVFALPEN
jgi:hypothetical protein